MLQVFCQRFVQFIFCFASSFQEGGGVATGVPFIIYMLYAAKLKRLIISRSSWIMTSDVSLNNEER